MLKNDKKKRDIILSLILAAVVLALLIYVDKEMHYSMLASIIQKAAIYSLLAVSLNLLNGFTGLFSLGQAGFMMVGAYTYAPSTSTRASTSILTAASSTSACPRGSDLSRRDSSPRALRGSSASPASSSRATTSQ